MQQHVTLRIDGLVGRPLELTFADLAAVDPAAQVADVRELGAKRSGGAVRFAAVLTLAEPQAEADYLTLHASADDFHASVPLAAVREQGLLIYRDGDGPLAASAGGPVRFFIPDTAACHTAEVDECANVKFVDRIELSQGRGYDNRPADQREHRALHERETEKS